MGGGGAFIARGTLQHTDFELSQSYPCNKCGNGSLAAPRPPPSAKNLQMLHNANALDIALYAYAAERFDAHFDARFPG